MKKFTFLLTTLLAMYLYGSSQVFITELADPNNNLNARYIELYNAGVSDVDFTEGSGWQILKYVNGSLTSTQSINLTGTISAGAFYIIAYDYTAGSFLSVYGFAPDQLDAVNNGVAGANGDDPFELIDGTGTVVDQFGVPGVDGTSTSAEYEDGRAERVASVMTSQPVYADENWTTWSDGPGGDFVQTKDAPGDFDPGLWIGTVAGPVIVVSPPTLSGFSYIEGSGPSSSQSFTVEGSDLTDDVVVTPSTNYEISLDDITYQLTPIALTQSGGAVSTTTIYTRLQAGLSAADYNENIVVSSTDATDKTVTCEGSVIAIESLPFSETFDGSSLPTGWSSADFTIENSSNSGGSPNEAELAFFNANAGTSHVTSPPINSNGKSELILSWNQSVDFYEGGAGTDFTIRVLTSIDGSDFSNVAWEQIVTADEVAQKIVTLDNADGVGSGTFYVRWLFYQNNTDRLSYWNIDDVSIADQIEWANLQWPGSGTITLGDSYSVYAQVLKSGITEPGGQGSNITAWIGYSTSDTDPSTWTDWVEASYNTDVGDNDEYIADLGSNIVTSGTYYYASRFQYGSAPYVYGGFQGGFWDGSSNVSGVLFVNPSGVQIDWCNLQWPGSGSITLGGDYDVYAQVYELGITNSPGQGAGITAWIGFSTTDTDPSTWTDWVEASYNTDVGDNDEYFANLSSAISGPGTYYYASRFKLDLSDYVYGGYNGGGGGFWDGITNISGELTVELPSIVITEVMQNPAAVTDANGEWFELYNLGGADVDIDGYVIADLGSDTHTINNGGPLTIPTGGFIVLGINANSSTNGGLTVDYEYSSFNLANGDDEIILYMPDGTTVIDGIAYDGGPDWPDPSGASMTLNPSFFDALDNDDGLNWYEATSSYGDGDLGTPGAENDYPTTTWTGASDDTWNNDDNWSTIRPDAGLHALIPGSVSTFPVIYVEGAETNDLTIEAGASLEIFGTLTVNGIFTNDGDLTIKSEEFLTGSLITNSPVDGTMERYLSGNTIDWHLMSSPLEYGDAQAGIFLGMFMQNFDNSTYTYEDIWDENTLLNVMEGYAVYSTLANDNTVYFTGTFNEGPEQIAVTTGFDSWNWNLIGNPYPCSIDWESVTIPANMINEVHYIDAASGDDLEYVQGTGGSGSQYIAPGQGFFASVTGNDVFELDAGAKAHSGANLYKSDNPNLLILEASGDNFSDETWIHFNENAGVEHDGQFDAYKRISLSNPELPQLFSYTPQGVKLGVNGLPQTEVVPVGFTAVESGEFTISAAETGDFAEVILEDLLLETQTDLLTGSYTFNYESGSLENRFLLHFTTLGISENNTNELFNIYSFGSEVYVSSSEMASGSIHVYNLMGQEISQKQLNNELTRVSIDRTGYYIVNVVSDKGISSEKVFIQ